MKEWEIRREIERLERKRRKLLSLLAKFQDLKKGLPTTFPEDFTDLVEQLKFHTLLHRQLKLQASIRRLETEIKNELQLLIEENTKLQQKLQEPLSLALVFPTGGETFNKGSTLEIRWRFSGVIGERLRIGLLKRGVLVRDISLGAPTASGGFSWLIPAEIPPGNDYQISIYDPTTTSSVSKEFTIQ